MLLGHIRWVLCGLTLSACVSGQHKSQTSGPPQTISYFFDQLRMRDQREMGQLIGSYLRRARGEGGKKIGRSEFAHSKDLVKQATTALLSRPNVDSALFKMLPNVVAVANDFGAFEHSLKEIAEQGTLNIVDSRLQTRERATWYFILKNTITICKWSIEKQDYRKILRLISSANLKLPANLETYLYLQAYQSDISSPSADASRALSPQG